MPITRRKRANPPDQPENTNHLAGQIENIAEPPGTEHISPDTPAETENVVVPATDHVENISQPNVSPPPVLPSSVNGDRGGIGGVGGGERQDYVPSIEGGRRTSRGELFRRPPQPPLPPAPVAPTPATSLQAPTHEISLPLGNLLHLAYNPGYTGSDEARSALLHQLALESKTGGRARCWSCGSIAIVYDRWNTRSKSFGEVGVAFCEICGVWSVM